MTRRKPRIQTVEQADQAMDSLAWLRSQGMPNGPVRDLWDAAVAYRAEVHRLRQQVEPEGRWQRKVNGK